MAIREIDNIDREWIMAEASNGVALLARYHIDEPRKVAPKKIGAAVLGWRRDEAPDRPAEGDAFRALGCLLGQCAVTSGAGKWIVATDDFGTAIGVQHDASDWIFYPIDVVSKRMVSANVEEIAGAYDTFVAGLPRLNR